MRIRARLALYGATVTAIGMLAFGILLGLLAGASVPEDQRKNLTEVAVQSAAAIEGLKSGKIGHLGLDVYEEEGDLFFEDLSDTVIQDDTFSRLLTFPNVLITGHQAFFTEEALSAIAQVTLDNVTAFERGEVSGTELVGPNRESG